MLGGSPGFSATSSEVRHPEDLFIVDCLLPGKVRSLGRYTKVPTPRRVARLTVHECELRGGEHSQDLLDNAWALQAWLAQAEAGVPEAMNNVGEIYEQGVRGTPDYAQAAQWYRKAAAAGSRRGQRNWAAMLEAGLGVEANPAEALVWYRKAAGLTSEIELSAEREAERLRQELARLAAERKQLEEQLQEVNRELAALQEAEAEARARILELEREAAKAKEAKLAEQVKLEQERLTAQRARFAELEMAQERFRALLAELDAVEAATQKITSGATVLASKPPRIEFVQPDILATRGPGLLPLPASGGPTEIVGRVTGGLEIVSFTVNGVPQKLERGGYFHVSFAPEVGKILRFVAIDQAARRAEGELQVGVAPGSPGLAAASAPPVPVGKAMGKRWALVIANSHYRSYPSLDTARRDGEAVAKVLRELYGYEVRTVFDGSFLAILLALEELTRQAGPTDELLLYYAGHGRLEGQSKGYWIPVDASPEDRSTWLPNEVVTRHLANSRAARVLVIADSCYAGSLAGGAFEAVAPSQGQRSRTVLASGGLQPVLDAGGDGQHSVFARALLSVLQLASEPLSGSALAEAVAARVVWRSSQLGVLQQPVYAPLRHAGHEAGDFVLVPRT
jgi:TPR repeat protein